MFGIGTALQALASALLPATADGVKTIVNHYWGDKGKPQTVDDVVKLNASETAKLEAIAKLDTPTGQVHTWVNDVRAMQRPVAVLAILVGFILHPDSQMWATLVTDVTFYLFGDRSYMYLKQGGQGKG